MTAVAKLPTVDELAQEIRRVDGNHTLGAGALAEALMPFLAALSPAELGGVGLPVGQVSDGFSGHQRAVNLYGPIRCQPAPGTKLYTTPRAAEAEVIADANRWRAVVDVYAGFQVRGGKMVAYISTPQWSGDWADFNDAIDRQFEINGAALTPPSAKGEKES